MLSPMQSLDLGTLRGSLTSFIHRNATKAMKTRSRVNDAKSQGLTSMILQRSGPD